MSAKGPIQQFTEREITTFRPLLERLREHTITPPEVFISLNKDKAILARFKVYGRCVAEAEGKLLASQEKAADHQANIGRLDSRQRELRQSIAIDEQSISNSRSNSANRAATHFGDVKAKQKIRS